MVGRSGAHTQVGQRTLDAASRTCCLSSLSYMLLQCIVRKSSGKPSHALGLLSRPGPHRPSVLLLLYFLPLFAFIS